MGSGEGERRKKVQVSMKGTKRGQWEREERSKGVRQKRRRGQSGWMSEVGELCCRACGERC